MSRYLILALVLLICCSLVQAGPPPANGSYVAGWGMNPTKWQTASGSWSSGFCIYDPLAPELAGSGWVVGWNPTTYINYSPIVLELWIEMYMIQTYQYTSYQWHRLGNEAENICFTVEGTVQSNNGQWVSLVQGTEDMGYLYWRHNIFGGGVMGEGGSNNARNIPISWEYQWGNGLTVGSDIQVGWTTVDPNPDISFLIENACDHWFQFKGCFDLVYHEADGYYSLEMAGCPAPIL